MKNFSELQSTVPTYQVICEADTHSDCKIKFQFNVKALNEVIAIEKANDVVKDLNLKNISTKFVKI